MAFNRGWYALRVRVILFRKSKFWLQIFVKTRKQKSDAIGQKSKFWSKDSNFGWNIEMFVKIRNFDLKIQILGWKSEFCKILIKNRRKIWQELKLFYPRVNKRSSGTICIFRSNPKNLRPRMTFQKRTRISAVPTLSRKNVFMRYKRWACGWVNDIVRC